VLVAVNQIGKADVNAAPSQYELFPLFRMATEVTLTRNASVAVPAINGKLRYVASSTPGSVKAAVGELISTTNVLVAPDTIQFPALS